VATSQIKIVPIVGELVTVTVPEIFASTLMLARAVVMMAVSGTQTLSTNRGEEEGNKIRIDIENKV
jgi:hypothetical protein